MVSVLLAFAVTDETAPLPPPTHVPFTAKQPFVRLIPPVPYKVEVAAVKLAMLPIEKREPGEVVAIPTLPFRSIVSAVTDDVAKVEGLEVAI